MGRGRNTMGTGFDKPYVEVSKYYGYGVQYTKDRGFDIPWVGGQNTMDRMIDIPWVAGVKIPWVRGSIYHW